MATFIKPGYWLVTGYKPKHWLNLDELVSTVVTPVVNTAINDNTTVATLQYPVENSYVDNTALFADQVNQTVKYFQYVIGTDTYYEKLVTSTGAIGDYRELTADEVTTIVLQGNSKQPVNKIYASAAAMYADQKKQITGFLYRTSNDDAHFEYLGTRNGNASDYVSVGGSDISGLVPYTGATTNVNLNNKQLTSVSFLNSMKINGALNSINLGNLGVNYSSHIGIGSNNGRNSSSVLNSIFIGNNSGEGSTNTDQTVVVGNAAWNYGIGTGNTILGYYAGREAHGDNNTLLGTFRGGYTYSNGVTLVGADTNTNQSIKFDLSSVKTIANNGTDIDTGTDNIILTGHGFTPDTYIVLGYSSDGELISGLNNNQFYRMYVNDANTLWTGVNLTSTGGAAIHSFYTILDISNSSGLGFNAIPSKPNQVMLGDLNVTEVKTYGTIVSGSYTVAALPTGVTGARAYVIDSNVVAAGNFGTTVVTGGANIVPVFYDGTNWIIA